MRQAPLIAGACHCSRLCSSADAWMQKRGCAWSSLDVGCGCVNAARPGLTGAARPGPAGEGWTQAGLERVSVLNRTGVLVSRPLGQGRIWQPAQRALRQPDLQDSGRLRKTSCRHPCAQVYLDKPLGVRFSRGNDGGAYVVRSDEKIGSTDPSIEVRGKPWPLLTL